MSGVNAPSADVDIDLSSLFFAIGRNWLRIAAFTLLVTGLAASYAFLSKPGYRAEARIYLLSQESEITRLDRNQGVDPSLDKEGVTSQVESMRSSAFLADVVRIMSGKDARPEYQGAFAELQKKSMLSGILAPLTAVIGSDGEDDIAIAAESLLADDAVKPLTTSQLKAAQELRERLDIYALDNSRVIVVSYKSASPQFAKSVADLVTGIYQDVQKKAKLERNSEAARLLKPEIERLEAEVRKAESDIASYRSESGLLVSQNNSSLADQQLGELQSELSRVTAARASTKARAEAVAAALRTGASIDTVPEVIASDLISRLREREVELRADIADLSTTLLDGHPRLKALRSQLSDMQEQIRREAGKVQKGLEQEAATAQLREEELRRELNRLKSASGQAGEQEVRLRELERNRDSSKDALQSFRDRYNQALSRQNQNYAPVDASVDPAERPVRPVSPNKPAIVGAAFGGSLLLSIISVMMAELFSGRAMRPAPTGFAPVHQVEMSEAEHSVFGAGAPASAAAAVLRRAVEAAQTRAVSGEEEASTKETDPVIAVSPLKATTRRAAANEPSPAEPTIRLLAERIVAGGLRRVVAVSPEGDEAAAASIMLARFISDTGLRTLVVDLTTNGVISAAMLEDTEVKGVTDILCSEAQFGEIIHPDLYSSAHVVPVGIANPARAVRAIERLPMIVNALNTAYEMLFIECGPADPSTVDRLLDDDTVLVMNAVNARSRPVVESSAAFLDEGYEDVVMVTLDGSDNDDGGLRRTRAA